MLPDKLYLSAGGGWGDIVRLYYRDENLYGFLNSIKQRFPKTHIKILTCSHNSEAEEIWRYHPAIDEFHNYVYQLDGEPYFRKYRGTHTYMCTLRSVIKTPDFTWEEPKIYLSPDELKLENDILEQGKYIAINPFAGTQDRIALSLEKYLKIADRIIDELKYNVVLLGGNHKRQGLLKDGGSTTVGSDPHYIPMLEECTYERSGLLNLVNKTNIRFATHISTKGIGFVGNFSGPLIAPWCKKIKTATLVIANEHAEKTSKNCSISAWPTVLNLPFSKAIYMRDNTVDQAIEQVIGFWK